MRPGRRAGEAVLALLAVGVWLLMPPVISLFVEAPSLLGIPLLVLYLFGVWLALIVATALLARRLPRGQGRLPGLPRRGEPDEPEAAGLESEGPARGGG